MMWWPFGGRRGGSLGRCGGALLRCGGPVGGDELAYLGDVVAL